MSDATSVETRKEATFQVLSELQDLLAESGDEAGRAEADALAEKLRAEEVQIVVMGEFKRGKSSLINALIGKPLLPVAAVPLTAVVTAVKGGEREAAFAEFLNGRELQIPPAAIADYVSEERNPRNEKQVSRVVVETPASFLEGGTLLVDTPGAGSVYRHNTELTQRYIPHCDAVLLVLAADPPIGESEVEFLHSIRRWARKLFVVQNKIDYLSDADLRRSIAFTEKVLRDALGEASAALFPVSAKRALEAAAANDHERLAASGLPALVRALETFLAREKRTVVLESVRSRVIGLLERQRFQTELHLGAAKARPERRESTRIRLRLAVEEAKRRQYEVCKLYQAEVKDHATAVEEALYARTRAESKRIAAELEKLYGALRAEPAAQMRAKLNAAFRNGVEDSFTRLLAEEEPRWADEFRRIGDRALASTLELLNRLLSEAATVLGVEYRPLSKPDITVAAPAVWFVIEEVSVWSGGIQSTPTLRVFKPFFWRALRAKVAEAMDINAGRLRYDYSRRLQAAAEEVVSATQAFFDSSISVLERAAAKPQDARSTSDLALWTQRKERIAGLAERLARA